MAKVDRGQDRRGRWGEGAGWVPLRDMNRWGRGPRWGRDRDGGEDLDGEGMVAW